VLGVKFHSRIIGLVLTLSAVDLLFMRHSYIITLVKGASVQLVFGFEVCNFFN